LNFLCEMAHPLVRPDSSEVSRLIQIYNEVLTEDGFEVVEKSRIAGKPFFVGRIKITGKDSIFKKGLDIKQIMNAEYVTLQISLIESSVENSRDVVNGIAKELNDSWCKFNFEQREHTCDKNWDLPRLMKENTTLL